MIFFGRAFLSCLLTAMLAVSATLVFAQEATSISPKGMRQGVVLNLTTIEALAGIGKQHLAGVLSFVAPEDTILAFANLLLADHKALKRFVKFGNKRFKIAGAITRWEKQVLLLVVGLNEGKDELPPGMKKVPKGLIAKVSELALAPGVTPDDFRARVLTRGGK